MGLSRAVFKWREGEDRVTAMDTYDPLYQWPAPLLFHLSVPPLSQLRCLYSKRLGLPCVRVGNTERFLYVVDCIFTPSFLKLTKSWALG